MSTIIAELTGGTWTAWVEDYPCDAFGGDSAAVAVTRLCQANGIDETALACRYSRVRENHMEFTLTTCQCPDCGGSGEYVGLTQREDCKTCCGSGRV